MFSMQTRGLGSIWLLSILSIALAAPAYSQLETSLSAATREQYCQYVKDVEAEMKVRWQKSGPVLMLDEKPEQKTKARGGEFVIWEIIPEHESKVRDGLVHDWVGAMYVPRAKVADVVRALGDWKNQKRFYPEVIDSNLISRNGDTSVGHWRLKRTKFVTVVLDVDLVSKVANYSNRVTTVTTHSTRVSEVLEPGETDEKVLPDGEGHGYLWAFDAFWTLRQDSDGVYAECRTVSLSRTIPPALAWMVGPLVNTMPRESLLTTLRGTKTATLQ